MKTRENRGLSIIGMAGGVGGCSGGGGRRNSFPSTGLVCAPKDNDSTTVDQ